MSFYVARETRTFGDSRLSLSTIDMNIVVSAERCGLECAKTHYPHIYDLERL